MSVIYWHTKVNIYITLVKEMAQVCLTVIIVYTINSLLCNFVFFFFSLFFLDTNNLLGFVLDYPYSNRKCTYENFEDTKGVIRSREVKRMAVQKPNEKGKTITYRTLHKKLNIKQLKTRVDLICSERVKLPAPHVAPILHN